MIIFKIGNTDYTDYVNKRSYVANKIDETASWRDGNSTIHTTVVRTRISAKIQLLFTSETSHTAFVNAMAAACVDGYWTVSLYVNNTHSFETITARLDATAKPVFGNVIVSGNPVVSSVELVIEEA